MQAVILAAGRGTRLAPVTDHRSKAMVPAVGKPLVERVLDTLVASGVSDVVLVVAPEDQEIREHFQPRCRPRLRARFVVQEQRLGMAHALGLAAPLLDGSFVLSACDSICSAEHVAELVAASEDADAVLSLLDVDAAAVSKSAAVELAGEVVRRIVEKPRPDQAPSHTVSLPLYVLPVALLDLLARVRPSSRGEYELQDALQALIDNGSRVVGVRAPWRRQVSSPADLLELTRWLLTDGEASAARVAGEMGRDTVLRHPLRVDEGVVVGAGCELGPNVYLERGSRIGDNVVVRNAVVMRGAEIPHGSMVEDQVVTPRQLASTDDQE